jgi:hypothetical protein
MADDIIVDEARVEAWLLEKGDWVTTAELCAVHGCTERRLRDLDKRQGLCSRFAISRKEGGYKHISLATTAEWLKFKHSMRKHAIKELVRVAALDRRRAQAVKPVAGKPPANVIHPSAFERDTGQAIMPGFEPQRRSA